MNYSILYTVFYILISLTQLYKRKFQVQAGVIIKNHAENLRKLIQETHNRIIVYSLDENLDHLTLECIHKAMNEISKYSCVQFVDEQMTNYTTPFIHISKSDSKDVCRSHFTTMVNVSLGSSCGRQDRQCIRSILSALGVGMEHNRFDRYQYIHINRSNILPESIPLFVEHVYLEKDVEMVTEYDISSIMHFLPQEHSKSIDSLVITTKNHILDDSLGGEIRGHRHLLSHRDKQTLNRLFQCSNVKHHKKDIQTCLRNGYISENGECNCPYAFTGSRCEILSYSSRFNVPTCGVIKEREGEIVSPNYPDRYSRGVFCQWLIEGTAQGDRILFRINQLDLEHENLMPGDRCADKITVWPHGTDVVTKSLSCLQDEVSKYKNRWYSTQYNWLLIEFRSDPWGQHDHEGFNISYKIIDAPTPSPPPPQSSRGDEWRRKWKMTGKPKDENEAKTWSASMKTRLLNTISRQGLLFCYRCDNETHCGENNLQREFCKAGDACAYRISKQGVTNWRGCVHIDACLEGWHESECYESIENYQHIQRCIHCCAANLCNYAASYSNSGTINYALVLIIMCLIMFITL